MAFADGCAGFVQVVFSDVGDAAVDFLDSGLGFLPVAAEFLFPAHRLLYLAQCFLMMPETVGWLIVAAVTQCGKAGDAHVNTDCTLRCRQWIGDFLFCLDGNIPFASPLADCDVLDCARDVLAFPVAYPAQFRQVYPTVLFLKLDALRIAEAVTDSLALEPGKVGSFGEEVPVG